MVSQQHLGFPLKLGEGYWKAVGVRKELNSLGPDAF